MGKPAFESLFARAVADVITTGCIYVIRRGTVIAMTVDAYLKLGTEAYADCEVRLMADSALECARAQRAKWS